VLLYQRESGGWPKNIDMAVVLSERAKAEIAKQKGHDDSLIDNGATYTQMDYLARAFNATGQQRFKESFIEGVDYLLKAQYENGGWPQYYPKLKGYYKHITFNDDAMVGVMELLRKVARKDHAYSFVDEARRARAETAVAKGTEIILKTQIVVNGKRTVWCAQHDEVTLAPAPARSYEHASLSGMESVGVVRFLMGVEHPDGRIVDAVESAVAWFKESKLTGVKLLEKPDPSFSNGFDRVVVEDANAGPLWARFYEINTGRPIFSGRDGVIKYSLAEIEQERRTGYNWYTKAPAELLEKDYPAWHEKWGKRSARRNNMSHSLD
jgi:PelA/Pel-15E family pectate lyase